MFLLQSRKFLCIRAKRHKMDKDKLIGKRIKFARKRLGLTQEETAVQLQLADCDISRGTLAKIEVGIRHLQAKEIQAFAKVLKLDYKEFLEGPGSTDI